ncbi:MAG: hypothetical protein AAGA73_03015 [Pseudomonadota bacterium]
MTRMTNWSRRVGESISGRPKLVRWLLAGPVTIIVTFLVMMGMALWFPEGAARVNNIALPLILFPLIWAVVFFYVCLEENLPRAVLLMSVLVISHIGLLTMV